MPATYALPHTRLPFVNSEFAQLRIGQQTRLVTSIWGGTAGGRIFLIDPESGACESRRLPEGEPGAYMLKTGTLDDPSLFDSPQMAIFTVDLQPFHQVPEGIPSFERGPGS